MKNIPLRIFNVALIILSVVSAVMGCILLYYTTLGKEHIPSAVVSTYASSVTDPLTEEEKPIIEANYYANKNGKGYEVIELLFNCYSGVGKQSIYSRGFQIVYDENGEVIPYVYNDKSESVFQYNRDGDTSFITGHVYSWGDPMLIDIDEKLYAVKLDGKYSVTTYSGNVGKCIRTWLFGGINLIFEGTDNFTIETVTEYNYTFKDLLLKLKDIIKSCSNGTGDYSISLVDLGDFLHIYDIDESNGQISGTPVGNNAFVNSYFSMKVHYDNRGMVWADQSIFGSVAGDSQFNISGISKDVDYWKTVTEYKLTEQDFEARYTSADNGYYYSLSSDKISELKNFNNIVLVVDFNISNLGNVNVLGFDHYALYGTKVQSLSIKSKTQKTFNLLVGSLKDTGLTTISTENVTINNVNSGVEL